MRKKIRQSQRKHTHIRRNIQEKRTLKQQTSFLNEKKTSNLIGFLLEHRLSLSISGSS